MSVLLLAAALCRAVLVVASVQQPPLRVAASQLLPKPVSFVHVVAAGHGACEAALALADEVCLSSCCSSSGLAECSAWLPQSTQEVCAQ